MPNFDFREDSVLIGAWAVICGTGNHLCVAWQDGDRAKCQVRYENEGRIYRPPVIEGSPEEMFQEGRRQTATFVAKLHELHDMEPEMRGRRFKVHEKSGPMTQKEWLQWLRELGLKITVAEDFRSVDISSPHAVEPRQSSKSLGIDEYKSIIANYEPDLRGSYANAVQQGAVNPIVVMHIDNPWAIANARGIPLHKAKKLLRRHQREHKHHNSYAALPYSEGELILQRHCPDQWAFAASAAKKAPNHFLAAALEMDRKHRDLCLGAIIVLIPIAGPTTPPDQMSDPPDPMD
jgi:hypothetical protein